MAKRNRGYSKIDPWGSRCRSTTSGKFVKCDVCGTCKRKK